MLNEGYIPSEQEVLRAQDLIQSFEMQCKQGKAVIQFKGKMIDAAVVTRAKNLLSRVAVKSSRS